MKKISLIMPVYNEEEGIDNFNRSLFATLDTLRERYSFEVIYVADKSQDDTVGLLRKIAGQEQYDDIRIIALSRRFGHQMSLVAGLDLCTGDAAILMDADLEHPPAVIPSILQQFEEGYDVVNTKRIYNKHISVFRKYSSKYYYRFLNFLSSDDLGENLSDFRLVSRRVIDVFSKNIREHNQYLRGLFRWVGFTQKTIEFTSGTRIKGSSKYSLTDLFHFASQGIISFSKLPLEISIGIGFLFSLLSALYGAFAVVAYFLTGTLPQGWASIVALVSLVSGVQLTAIGVIGLYIAAIFDEVKNRPLYIVENEYGRAADGELTRQ
jgi:polyisoprenyl-phosphate glycosyltransferase